MSNAARYLKRTRFWGAASAATLLAGRQGRVLICPAPVRKGFRLDIRDIVWVDEIADKLVWKHAVLTAEVEEVLRGKCRFFKKQKGRVEGEHLYLALGRTAAGRYLAVYFILKRPDAALIVTARDMTVTERRRYEKK